MERYEGYEAIRFERIGAVLRVTLANPRNPLNAVDGAMHAELMRLFDDLRGERDARAVVLTGSGRAFSAGTDLQELSSRTPSPGEVRAAPPENRPAPWTLTGLTKPVIGAVNGVADGSARYPLAGLSST